MLHRPNTDRLVRRQILAVYGGVLSKSFRPPVETAHSVRMIRTYRLPSSERIVAQLRSVRIQVTLRPLPLLRSLAMQR